MKYAYAVSEGYIRGTPKLYKVQIISEGPKQIKLAERVEGFKHRSTIFPDEACYSAADAWQKYLDNLLIQETELKERLAVVAEYLKIALQNIEDRG